MTSPLLADGAATYTPGISERRGSTTTYQLDGLKNTFAQSNASGGHVSSRNYDAFGAVTSSSGTHQGPFGYGGAYGYQTDPDTGLMLLGHRYYDSSTGRFLTRDPIKDGRNWYGYGGGFANPVHSVDPDGLMPFRADVVPTDEGLAWNGRSAPYGCPWLDGVAGFGDGVSGGLSRIVRGWLGAGDVVNTDSGAYGWGEIGGTAYSYLLPGPKGRLVPAPGPVLRARTGPRTRPGSTIPHEGGPPNGTRVEERPGGGTIRKYDQDGNAETDYDFGHDHSGAGDPHAHDWTIGPDGKLRRGSPRPIHLGETYD